MSNWLLGVVCVVMVGCGGSPGAVETGTPFAMTAPDAGSPEAAPTTAAEAAAPEGAAVTQPEAAAPLSGSVQPPTIIVESDAGGQPTICPGEMSCVSPLNFDIVPTGTVVLVDCPQSAPNLMVCASLDPALLSESCMPASGGMAIALVRNAGHSNIQTIYAYCSDPKDAVGNSPTVNAWFNVLQ
jgi:hypothetical protein